MASKNWLWAGGIVVAMGVAVGVTLAVSSPAEGPAVPAPAAVSSAATTAPSVVSFTMRGSYNVKVDPGASTLADGAACRGTDHAQAQLGTPVRVYDVAGKLLASGALPQGKFAKTPIGSACVFPFSVGGVPDGPASYSVTVGDHGGRPVDSATAHSWVVINP